MSYNINKYTVKELANEESKTEILLETNKDTELHIEFERHKTIIKLPFGNKFDIVGGRIIIHSH